ncbi:MAG TPA: 2,4-dienoyl-CoA reductase [Fredinandcohnia sp.]|nr:2,4-dienoyl-CoA reductase [Fredinandcohnia sp.]
MEAEDLTGRTAVVTGGATGIGFAIAKALGRRGANVVIASRKKENLERAEEELRRAGVRGEVTHHVLDVRDPEAVNEVAERVAERFGPAQILVNNAAGNFVVPAAKLSPNGWRTVVDIVLNGTFYCSHAFGTRMMEAGRAGTVINVVATYAWTGGPGTAHSAAAKAGVLSLTQSLAVEWGVRGIRTNAIAPGPIENTGGAEKLFSAPAVAEAVRQNVPLGRFGTPDEIGEIAAWLASDRAAYVNGACIVADGGAWLNKGFLPFLDAR